MPKTPQTEEEVQEVQEPQSALAHLAAQVKERVNKDTFDYTLEHWKEPAPVLTFKALTHEQTGTLQRKGLKAMKAAKSAEDKAKADLAANIQYVIEATVDITIGDFHTGEAAYGDEELAKLFGAKSQAQVCRKLFERDGRIITAVDKINQFSGYTQQNKDTFDDILGE